MTQPPPYNPPPGAFGPPPPQYAPQPPPPAAPEFLAVDRHNSVVVDMSGITFEIRDAEAEFSWPEIHTVHYKATPNGKALVVAVVLHNGQLYECQVEAKPKERLREWFAGLQAILGYYKPLR
ncbi:hypothetical protein SAMN06272735_5514 [Streptomyces sp. TLI_55]|uniref:hypothetical protein n=1 Tax=Streptomyces sp. TLI_55 TaxID=1938861 RepID=UPI000BD9B86C|nr:hypothetical protein [Streptomyces sp. TLI_55]SNX63703.1 hypothetical protein SAMN06272735_5514 [Streptomyces sp. TLI_55]